MCYYPKFIHNPKYKATKKNGGNIPPILDQRVKYVPIGCGNCMQCRKQKANTWRVRLLEDIRTNTNAQFVTLTFSNDSYAKLYNEIPDEVQGYERDNEIAILATRRFLERWRKKYKKSVRHWLITELGHKNTENIHLHGFIWTDNHQHISKIWGYGYVWDGYTENGKRINYVNERTINYCVKYVHKIDSDHKYYKSKVLTSAGIGANYTTRWDFKKHKYVTGKTKTTYTTRQGYEFNLPIYYRNKAFTEEEREKLWIDQLDKQIRYVEGIKIDVSKGEQEYWQALKIAQETNKKLGYGNDEIDWNRKMYEEHIRKIKQYKRLRESQLAEAIARL